MSRRTQSLKILFFLSLIGVGLSIYGYLQHFGVATGSFCTINATFNCDVANRGPYGTFMGLPVSLIGIVGYGLLVAGFAVKMRKHADRELTQFLLMASMIGLIFAFYLSGIEVFVLHAYCIICLASQFVILLITILTTKLWLDERRSV